MLNNQFKKIADLTHLTHRLFSTLIFVTNFKKINFVLKTCIITDRKFFGLNNLYTKIKFNTFLLWNSLLFLCYESTVAIPIKKKCAFFLFIKNKTKSIKHLYNSFLICLENMNIQQNIYIYNYFLLYMRYITLY